MNRSNFMKNTASCAGLLMIFILAADSVFAQAEPAKPVKVKRVFTNEDLSKFGEKYGADGGPTQLPPQKGATEAGKTEMPASGPKTPATSEERSYWVKELKQAETELQKAKAEQTRYAGALEKFEQKQRDAQTDFQKNLSQNQVADSQKNLARATEEVRQAEEKKAKLLADAGQKGFKPGDLREVPEAPGPQK
jgi:hypothetical protein